MINCIYTTQKNKKLKKWIDGFVARKGRGLVLYDEEKKAICQAGGFSIREDGNVEASVYLIYLDDPGLFSDTGIGMATDVCGDRPTAVAETEDRKDATPSSPRQGRSADEIYSLFKQ